MSNIVHVYLDLAVNNRAVGRLGIRLYRDLFPEGVENFARICQGDTMQQIPTGHQDTAIWKTTRRSYDGCVCYQSQHDGYLLTGDIYANNGSDAGTIYNDQPIRMPEDAERYIPHDIAGLISLVPKTRPDPNSAEPLQYDSTFLITLAPPEPAVQERLDRTQVVIGYVTQGHAVLEAINQELAPRRSRAHARCTIAIQESGIVPPIKNVYKKPRR